MNYTENDLKHLVKGYEFIKSNKQSTVFFNTKTGSFINSTKNGGSYGIWIGKKWLTISKIELTQKVVDNSMSDACKYLLSQF